MATTTKLLSLAVLLLALGSDALTIISTTPTDNSANIDPVSTIQIQCSSTGLSIQETKSLRLYEPIHNGMYTLMETFSPTNGVLSGDVWKIPSYAFVPDNYYHFEMDEGFIESSTGLLPAISNADTWNFHTAPLTATWTPDGASSAPVPVDTTLELTFNADIKFGNPDKELNVYQTDDDTQPRYSFSYPANGTLMNIAGKTLTLTLPFDLNTATHYYVRMFPGFVKSVIGSKPAAAITGTTTWAFETAPLTATWTPDGASSAPVPVDTTLELTFNADIKFGNPDKELNVYQTDDDNQPRYSFSYPANGTLMNIAGKTLTLTLPFDLNTATHYYVRMFPGFVKSVIGSTPAAAITGTTTWTFETVAFGITSRTPQDDATDVPVATNTLELRFSADIILGSAGRELRIFQDDVLLYEYTPADPTLLAIAGKTLTITLPSNLNAGSQYYVKMRQGFVKSLNEDEPIAAAWDDTTWNFETADGPGNLAEGSTTIEGQHNYIANGQANPNPQLYYTENRSDWKTLMLAVVGGFIGAACVLLVAYGMKAARSRLQEQLYSEQQ